MEWDPLVARGDHIVNQRKRMRHMFGIEAIASFAKGARSKGSWSSISAFFQTILALILTTYIMHMHPNTCGGILMVLITLNIFLWFLGRVRWRMELGFRSLVGLFLGMCSGLWIYANYMIYFFAYKDLRVYTNVLSSETPYQFTDAAILSFNHATKVDVSRSAGFQSFQSGGYRYCVAPVTDTTLDTNQPISVYAIGMDCCDSRAAFSCGDIYKSGAHAGLVMPRPEMFVHPSLEWLMSDYALERQRFAKAVELARYSFGIQPWGGDNHNETDIFVTWSYQPYKVQSDKKKVADWFVGWLVIFFFFFWILVARFAENMRGILGLGDMNPMNLMFLNNENIDKQVRRESSFGQ